MNSQEVCDMTDSLIPEKTSLLKDVVLRPATLQDLKALISISRLCFSDNFRWRSIYPIAKQYWQTVVESKACETLVLEDSIGIFAYSVLAFDWELWAAEDEKRNGSQFVRVLSILCCPFPATWKRLWRVALARLNYKGLSRNSLMNQDHRKKAWSEITAVLSRRRNQGYNLLLIRARKERALAAGAAVIYTHVDSDNIASRRGNEKMGFELVCEDIRGCLYRQSVV